MDFRSYASFSWRLCEAVTPSVSVRASVQLIGSSDCFKSSVFPGTEPKNTKAANNAVRPPFPASFMNLTNLHIAIR